MNSIVFDPSAKDEFLNAIRVPSRFVRKCTLREVD